VAQSPQVSKIALTHDAFSRHVANRYRHFPESDTAPSALDKEYGEPCHDEIAALSRSLSFSGGSPEAIFAGWSALSAA